MALRLAKQVASVFQQLFAARWSRALEKSGQTPLDWLKTWAAAFQASGIRAEDVDRALNRIYDERFEWPPLPLEFLALADIVTNFAEAFREAQRNMEARRAGFNPKWSHAFLFWVVQREYNPVRFVELPYSKEVERGWTVAVRRWQFRECAPIPPVEPERALPRPGGAHSAVIRQEALKKARSAMAVDMDEVRAVAAESISRVHQNLGKMLDK